MSDRALGWLIGRLGPQRLRDEADAAERQDPAVAATLRQWADESAVYQFDTISPPSNRCS